MLRTIWNHRFSIGRFRRHAKFSDDTHQIQIRKEHACNFIPPCFSQSISSSRLSHTHKHTQFPKFSIKWLEKKSKLSYKIEINIIRMMMMMNAKMTEDINYSGIVYALRISLYSGECECELHKITIRAFRWRLATCRILIVHLASSYDIDD